MSLLMQQSNGIPAPPSSVAPGAIPPEMDALVLRCLSRDPALRPATADELWDRLRHLGLSKQWDHQRARAWWEAHEPALTQPRA
jgi:serine/threonine-protein kinase